MKRGLRFWFTMATAALLLAGAGLATGEVVSVDGGVEFRYEDPSAGSVSVAGDFNGWDMGANPMTAGDGGVWSAVIDLDPGVYEYKFVVNGSDWIADPENPKVVGAYGNSQLTIDDGGKIVAAAAPEAISNTRANSRVMLNGWYRATYETEGDVPDDPRWRLNRPDHEVYLSVKPTVTSQVKGDATLRIATGTGDIKEISADFYSGHMEFEGGPFSVTGYYNEERVQFDNPLKSLGHRDLIGSIPEEQIAYGRGTQGVILDLTAFDADVQAVYANEYESDITNDPSVYDNTDTDLLAGRLTREFGPLTVGATYVSYRNGWWMDWTGTNTSPHLQAYIDSTGSTSDWFELANSEDLFGVDFALPIMDRLTVSAEGAIYQYDSRWDVGNKEKVEGEDYSNGAIDVEAGTMDGWLGIGAVEGSPIGLCDMRLEYQMGSIGDMGPDEEFTTFDGPRFLDDYEFLRVVFSDPSLYERTYTEVRYDGSPLVAGVVGDMPEIDLGKLEFDVGVAFGILDLGLEFDWTDYELSFPESVTATYDTVAVVTYDAWTGSSTRLAGRARANIIPKRFWVEFEGEMMRYEDDLSYEHDGDGEVEVNLHNEFGIYERNEMVFRGWFGLSENWAVLTDLRHVSYEVPTRVTDEPDEPERAVDSVYEYESESFFAPYFALAYTPRKNIEVRISYGVDPFTYADTPVAGRGNGREVWRRNYLWEHSAYGVIDAEEALEDAQTIGLMAVITF